jgi:hypothetical protein
MGYTKIQFIAYSINTGPNKIVNDIAEYLGIPASQTDLENRLTKIGKLNDVKVKNQTSAKPLLDDLISAAIENGIPISAEDIAARIALVKTVLEEAYTGASTDTSTLKLFMMPEFFFRGKSGAYSLPDAELVVSSLQELVKESPKWKDWLFVFGSIISMADPNRTMIEQEVYNTVLIQKGGFTDSSKAWETATIVLKEFKSRIDFIKEKNLFLSEDVVLERVFHPLTENQYRLEKMLRKMLITGDESFSRAPISFTPSELALWKKEKGKVVSKINGSTSDKQDFLKSFIDVNQRRRNPVYGLVEKYLKGQDLLTESHYQTEQYLQLMLADPKLKITSPKVIEGLDRQLKTLKDRKILLSKLEQPVQRLTLPEYNLIANFLKSQKNLAEQLLSERSEVQAHLYDVSSVFDFKSRGIDGITFGLEVCLDHAKEKLARSKDLPAIDIQLVPSCGMSIEGGSTVARLGGYIFNCDGLQSKPGEDKKCHSRVMQIKDKKEVLDNLEKNLTKLPSKEDKLSLLIGVPKKWIAHFQTETEQVTVLNSGTNKVENIETKALMERIEKALNTGLTSAIVEIENIRDFPFPYWPKVISTGMRSSTSVMAEDLAAPTKVAIKLTTGDINQIYAHTAGELHLYDAVALPAPSFSGSKSVFPHFASDLNYALSSEPVLLNGMKVIFDRPVSVYPVTLESKAEARRNGNG